MGYVEAFKKLGYDLSNSRQDWSADKSDGVCLALRRSRTEWNKELNRSELNLWRLETPGSNGFEHKPGHKKRALHIARARDEFDGWLDVIRVGGLPGGNFEDAEIWNHEKRGIRWRIQEFDEESGFFFVATETFAAGVVG